MTGNKVWWLFMMVALFSGIIVLDHLLPSVSERLAVLDERSYQERFGSFRRGSSGTSTINAIVLMLSNGTTLQLSFLGDFISAGDTIELQQTRLLQQPLQLRKVNSRLRDWQVVDGNKLDYQIYPYLVFACSFLLLFRWSSEYWRWSLQAGLGVMLVCWIITLVGTGGLGRLMEWF